MAFFVIPSDADECDFDFLIELLSTTKKHFLRNQEGSNALQTQGAQGPTQEERDGNNVVT